MGRHDSQRRILQSLLRFGYATPANLAERLGIKKSTVYTAIRALCIKGLVETADDEPRKVYRITPDGRHSMA